jgi:hypothetical protein
MRKEKGGIKREEVKDGWEGKKEKEREGREEREGKGIKGKGMGPPTFLSKYTPMHAKLC